MASNGHLQQANHRPIFEATPQSTLQNPGFEISMSRIPPLPQRSNESNQPRYQGSVRMAGKLCEPSSSVTIWVMSFDVI